MKRIYFDGQTLSGAYIQSAFVVLSEDYTMRQLVNAIKDKGFVSFKAGSMKRLVQI